LRLADAGRVGSPKAGSTGETCLLRRGREKKGLKGRAARGDLKGSLGYTALFSGGSFFQSTKGKLVTQKDKKEVAGDEMTTLSDRGTKEGAGGRGLWRAARRKGQNTRGEGK